ncbi:TetR/AcrR family transcriptional regulator [Clostridium cellulovorans]|uniref:Transcriptional regulator, TetR family n=1 Tax=Clostridium cellulovorans (strain ATCC 35296 / DSM 3052 / OCM 3 / 743B) TaxID=573061 RepID=D9SMH5_CLOC7|nr:TetR/AcrR family transcriptional regulator [Clostridium cellulovorans]ADL53831.1 transcriptional regulator, TetR family [Clostridium cellulovorans 743B]
MPKILENVKDLLLDEGKKVFSTQGYKAANIRDITKACGIGTGTFYNYFQNKGELAIEIFQRDWSKIISSIESLITEEIPLKNKLYTIFKYIDGFLKDHIAVFIEMASENYSYKETEVMTPLHEAINKVLTFHKEKGEINSELPLEKLTSFIVFNLINISKNKTINFNEFYDLIKI